MPELIKIGIVGAARILPAHLRALSLLRRQGVDSFRVTALASRRREDAEMFRKRGEGPTPRPVTSINPADPLAAPHIYVSDVQDDVEARVYDDWRQLVESPDVTAVEVPPTPGPPPQMGPAAR